MGSPDNPGFTITPFDACHQIDIDLLMAGISAEFEESIYSAKGSNSHFRFPIQLKWVALVDGVVAGTIGVLIIPNDFGVIKGMFVAKGYRGGAMQIASALMRQATHTAGAQHCLSIYLGTMTQFKAAQRFYEKQLFTRISSENLPANFPHNDLDTVFYKRMLTNP
jgi:ribosomal protein S18 acetylase RimI-like enzyme